MHEAYSSRGGLGSQDVLSGAVSDTERLSNLRQAIDSIEQRLSAQSSGNQFLGSESDLGLMQQHLDRLSNEVGRANAAGLTTSAGLPTTRSPAQGSSAPNAPAGGVPEFDAVTADILRRQQALNRPESSIALERAIEQQQEAHQQAQMLAQQHAQQIADQQAQKQAEKQAKQQKAAMDSIARHFGDLKKELAALKKDVAKPITVQPKMEANELKRIAEQLAGMQQAPVIDEQAFARLTNELAHLRSAMKDDLRKEMTATQDIHSRLDGLSMGVDALATQTGNAIMPRVDNLFSQIDSLRTTIDDLPQTLAITRIDDRLGEMFEKIEAIPVDLPDATAPDLTSLESRLDEISRALVAVSNMGTRAPKLDLSAIDRLEGRVADLAKSVTTMANETPKTPATSPEMQTLAARIESLTDRLGSFEKIAEKGDFGAASAVFAAPDISAIETQLQKLTMRLDEASSVNSTAAQISNLEAQIGKILRAMNKQSEGVAASVDLTPVDARLGQIENALVSSQQFNAESAQQAAQNAVAILSSQTDAGQLISELSGDLKALRDVTEKSGHKTGKTMADVGKVLTKVVQRLATIEAQMGGDVAGTETAKGTQSNTTATREGNVGAVAQVAQVANVTQTSAAPQKAAAPAAPVQRALSYSIETTGADDAPIETRVVEAPSIDPVDDLVSAHGEPHNQVDAESNRPLEPGTAPSVDNLVEKASVQLNAEHASLESSTTSLAPGVDTGKPDPIGAARRALQATTAEINAASDSVQVDAKTKKTKVEKSPSKLSGINLRKPIIVAAAATLLFILGTFGYKKFIAGGEVNIANKNAAVVEQTIETPIADPAIAETAPPENTAEAQQITEAAPEGVQPAAPRIVDGAEVEKPASVVQPTQDVTPAPSETVTATIDGKDPQKMGETIVEKAMPADEGSVQVSLAPEAESTPTVSPPEVVQIYQVPADAGSPAFVAAATKGNPKALFELGMRYSDGKIVKRDMVASAQWFERAADTGFAPAQYSIGSLYEKGIGVSKNIKTASSWYEKAAAQGNARAMHNLAVINAMGGAGEPDMDTAVRWFKQAANYGIKDSQFNLGILFGQGMGVPQNLADSFKWFAIAAKTGDTDAAAKRDEVAKAMDPANLEAARKEVVTWKPMKLDSAVNRVTVPKEWRSAASTQTGSASAVKTVQSLLNERGFGVGVPDGLIGPKTKKAIMEFQRSAGLPITGKVDKRLLSALGAQS